MSRTDSIEGSRVWCEWTQAEVSVRYQAPAAATMVAPPPVNQQGGAVTDFVLTIDARRVRGWIEGRRHICVGADGKHYTAVLEAEDTPGFEGVFNARIEELPGCVSYGEDLATARINLREALDLYLEEDAAEQN